MLDLSSEELRENDTHNEEGEQRRQNAPEHTEIGTLIFLFEVALDKLGEKEAVLFNFSEHNITSVLLLFRWKIPNSILTYYTRVVKEYFFIGSDGKEGCFLPP